MHRLGLICCVLVALSVTDAHWFAMQSLTWAKMIISASARSETTLTETVARTISGVAPCSHCEAIDRERESEGEQLLDLVSKNMVLGPPEARPVRAPARSDAGERCRTPAHAYALILGSDLDPPPRA